MTDHRPNIHQMILDELKRERLARNEIPRIELATATLEGLATIISAYSRSGHGSDAVRQLLELALERPDDVRELLLGKPKP